MSSVSSSNQSTRGMIPRGWLLLALGAFSALATFAVIRVTERDTAPPGMVWIAGGKFRMGDGEFNDALPKHNVTVDSFWMDQHEVTNAEFEKFVKATGYKTVAEIPPKAEDFPDAPPE